LPVVPEKLARFPDVDAPELDTILSAVRLFVGPATFALR